MPGVLPSVGSECCQTPCAEVVEVRVPGPAGTDGADGEDGTNGVNAFTTVSTGFTMPAALANVSVAVADSTWMTPGEPIFVQNAGTFQVVSKPTSTSVVLMNLGYAENVAAATAVASGNQVTPTGWRGDDGTDGAVTGLPLTTKGDLLTRDGSANVRIAVGANGTRLVADSAQASGQKYAKVNLADTAEVTGATGIAQGGTGQITANLGFNALSPVTTRGDIIVRNATVNARLAIGAANTLLASDATDPSWRKVVQADLAAGGPMSRYGLLGSLMGANFNVTTDQAITILSGVTRYIIDFIIVDNASINLTTAAGGIYTNASKAGTVIVASTQAYTALTTSAKWKALTLEAVIGTDVLTAATIYLSLTTAQGAASTANVWVWGRNLTP